MQNGIEISFAILVPGNRISYLLIRNWQLKFFLSSFFIIFDRLYDRRQAFIHSRDLILTCNTYMRSMTQATSYASCTASTFQSEGKVTMSTLMSQYNQGSALSWKCHGCRATDIPFIRHESLRTYVSNTCFNAQRRNQCYLEINIETRVII